MVQVKTDVKSLRDDHQTLAARVTALEAGGGTANDTQWRPTSVEILNICNFNETQEKGMTRTEAMALVGELKSSLDASLQPHVRDIKLRANRNYSIEIPVTVTADYLHEIKNTWIDIISNQQKKRNTDKVMYVRAQRHPEVKVRYGMLGKIKDWAVATLDGSVEPREFWAPDLKLMITSGPEEGPMGVKQATLLCEVQSGGDVTWSDAGLRIIAMTREAADESVKKFQLQRKK